MYTHSYDAKVVRFYKPNPDLGGWHDKWAGAFEIDLGFQVWKMQNVVLDEPPQEEYRTGTFVRLETRMHFHDGKKSKGRVYLGRIKKLDPEHTIQ